MIGTWLTWRLPCRRIRFSIRRACFFVSGGGGTSAMKIRLHALMSDLLLCRFPLSYPISCSFRQLVVDVNLYSEVVLAQFLKRARGTVFIRGF